MGQRGGVLPVRVPKEPEQVHAAQVARAPERRTQSRRAGGGAWGCVSGGDAPQSGRTGPGAPISTGLKAPRGRCPGSSLTGPAGAGVQLAGGAGGPWVGVVRRGGWGRLLCSGEAEGGPPPHKPAPRAHSALRPET